MTLHRARRVKERREVGRSWMLILLVFPLALSARDLSPAASQQIEADWERQVPGTRKVLCTGAAHHNTGVGPVMMLDLDQNRGTRKAMRNLTPEVGYPEINSKVFREVFRDELPGKAIAGTRNKTGWYSSPYPLSETQFLAVASFETDNAAPDGYALYLVDAHRNKELIYRAPGMSCYSPMPVRPRPKPRVLPDMVRGIDPATPGTMLVTDIYRGLPGVKRGEVKYLRVLETHSSSLELLEFGNKAASFC